MEHLRHGGPTLATYLAVLRRRRWIVMLCAILLPAAAAYFSVRQAPEYRASADVYVTNPNSVDGTALFANEPIETQAILARVPEVARIALRRAQVGDRTPGQFLGQSAVRAKGATGILEFSVTDRAPGVATRLASAYANAFAIYRGRLDTQSLVRARREVTATLEQLREVGRQDGELYAGLEETEQQLQTFEALQTSRANVIRRAGDAVDVTSSPLRNAAIGLVLGLVLGLGLALLLETLDTRVRSAAEVSQRLGLRLLARIPTPPRRLQKRGRLVMTDQPGGVHAEAFRMLRTNLEFATLDETMRSILVTSAVEGEGKSTTAANLAVTLTRAGKRVALVDLDLRKPSIDRFFSLSGAPGVTNAALGDVPLEEALHPIELEAGAPSRNGSSNGTHEHRWEERGMLIVLPAGQSPSDPGEFVGSRRLTEILTRVQEHVDVLIIDAPPLLRVGDAMCLSSFVDGVIVTTQLNLIRRGMLTETRRLLDTMPARKIGFVVTGSQREDRSEYGFRYGSEGAHRSEMVTHEHEVKRAMVDRSFGED